MHHDFVTAHHTLLVAVFAAAGLVCVIGAFTGRRSGRSAPASKPAMTGLPPTPAASRRLNPAVRYSPPGDEITQGIPVIREPVKVTSGKTMTELRDSDDADDATDFFRALRLDDEPEVTGTIVAQSSVTVTAGELTAHSDWYLDQMRQQREWALRNGLRS